MAHPLAELLERPPATWTESDVKHFIQEHLRRSLRSDAILCESVADGVVSLRVPSPTLQQAVLLMEYDLAQLAHEEAGYTIKKLRVRQG